MWKVVAIVGASAWRSWWLPPARDRAVPLVEWNSRPWPVIAFASSLAVRVVVEQAPRGLSEQAMARSGRMRAVPEQVVLRMRAHGVHQHAEPEAGFRDVRHPLGTGADDPLERGADIEAEQL